MRAFLERGHLAETRLVHDLARLLIAELVDACPLPLRQRGERRFGELRCKRQRLVAHDHTVPAEDGHEPG